MTHSHTITPRDFVFHGERVTRDWHGAGPGVTAFFNGLSIMFPEGERFFIEAVKAARTHVADPRLEKYVKAFIAQEALHTREHLAFNKGLENLGYPVPKLEQALRNRISWARKMFGPRRHLAVTCALEHFTAIFARQLMSNPAYLQDADPDMARMWRWHALEECEHKAVAFDVLKSWVSGLGGYALRVHAMFTITLIFNARIWSHIYTLLKADGLHRELSEWGRLMNWLFIRPGFLRHAIPAYLAYYRPGFHPGEVDDGALLERSERELAVQLAQ